MAPFPLVKFGYLLVKQISKPVANFVKRQAKASPFFRTWICIPPAQLYNWWEVNFRLRMMGLGRAKNVERLSEKEAIELGGEMLGEFVVFSIATIILVAEYQRGARKETAKEEQLQSELSRLSSRVEEMQTVTQIQKSQIQDLQKSLDSFTRPSKSKENTSPENTSYVKKIFGSQ